MVVIVIIIIIFIFISECPNKVDSPSRPSVPLGGSHKCLRFGEGKKVG